MHHALATLMSLAVWNTEPPAQPSAEQVFTAVSCLGINAESLASVGVTGSDVELVLDRIAENFEDVENHLGKLGSLASAHDTMVEARQAARRDPLDEGARAAYQAATAALEEAKSAVAQSRAGLVSLLFDSLAGSMETGYVFTHEPARCLPYPYRHADVAAPDLGTLSWALRLRDRIGAGAIPSAASQAISSAESQYAVQLALLRTEQHAASNQTAIDSWFAAR